MKLYVGNMPFSMDEGQVRALFEEHGTVDSVAIITDRDTGRPRGFGFVEMADDEACRNAMQALDNHMVDGRNLKVNEAKPRNTGGRGGGGGGGGGRW
jgi:RNA recognition motif-containing protein